MSEASVPKPEGVVFVTDRGFRIPVDLRQIGTCCCSAHPPCGIFQPVIEADLTRFMPDVVQIDAAHWPSAHLEVPPGPGYDTLEWAQKVLANSPVLGSYTPGSVRS